MNPRFYPYEVPDFRLKHHHTEELVEVSIYVSDLSGTLMGNVNGIFDPIAMARYLANGIGSA